MSEVPHRPLDADQEWFIGGHDRPMSQEDQLEQLASYLEAHYDLPDFTPPWKAAAPLADAASGDARDHRDIGEARDAADRYCAHLPDRITHAAMMVLGTAVDHAMPGVAQAGDVDVQAHEFGTVFVPSQPTGALAVALHSGGWWRGGGVAQQMHWQPEVAAVAELSGTTILDVDYPLAPEHTVAEMIDYVEAAIVALRRTRGAHDAADRQPVTVWGYSSGAALAALIPAAAHILTFPDFRALDGLPEQLRAGAELPATLPRALVQTATQDEIAAPVTLDPTGDVTYAEYVSRHRFSTPAIARQRVADTAEYLKRLS